MENNFSLFPFLFSLFFVPLHRNSCKGIHVITPAPVAELVDALDLGSSVSRRAGSSPVRRTRAFTQT